MNYELQQLRKKWVEAKKSGDTEAMELIERIGKAIKNNDLCRQCREKVASFNGDFCSSECQDKYYPPRKDSPSLDSLRKRLLGMARDKHIRSAPAQEKLI